MTRAVIPVVENLVDFEIVWRLSGIAQAIHANFRHLMPTAALVDSRSVALFDE